MTTDLPKAAVMGASFSLGGWLQLIDSLNGTVDGCLLQQWRVGVVQSGDRNITRGVGVSRMLIYRRIVAPTVGV